MDTAGSVVAASVKLRVLLGRHPIVVDIGKGEFMSDVARPKTIRKVTGKDKTLRRVVAKWADNMDRLAQESVDRSDLPWRYGERAQLSVLAGAVWLLNGTAFEEYGTQKKHHTQHGKLVVGREDIHFSIGDRGFKAEAKHKWAHMTPAKALTAKRLRDHLQMAVDASARVRREGQERLGILFATLMVKAQRRDRLDSVIKEWRRDVFPRVG